jgi:cbb3-type cytochrome oxidase maturation protein
VFPLAIGIAAIAVVAFIWAVRSGQFDDLDTPALRVLHDDEAPSNSKSGGTADSPPPGKA